MPLATEMIKVDGIEKPFGIVGIPSPTGFGGTLGNIGIIIGLELQWEGAESDIAKRNEAILFLRLFGKEERGALTGFFVSIPTLTQDLIVLAPAQRLCQVN